MHVAEILKRKGADIFSARPGDLIADAARLLVDRGVGALLIVEPDGSIGGILSERDIVRGLARVGPAILDRPISTLMTRDVLTCAPGDTAATLMRTMTERRIRHLPVMDGGRLVGLVSIGDVVKARIEEAEAEAEALRDYVAGG